MSTLVDWTDGQDSVGLIKTTKEEKISNQITEVEVGWVGGGGRVAQ